MNDYATIVARLDKLIELERVQTNSVFTKQSKRYYELCSRRDKLKKMGQNDSPK